MSASLGDFLMDLLDEGKFSDLTIKCGEKSHRVHRAIICPQSDALSAACSGHFKESQTGQIDLSHHNPDAVEIAIRYLYSHDYRKSRTCLNARSPQEIIQGNADVYALADQYFIESLKQKAEEEFTVQIWLWYDCEDFIRATRQLWNHDEYRGLYRIIESVVATNIDQLLIGSAAKLVKDGMAEGHLSFDMLEQVIQQKNAEYMELENEYLRHLMSCDLAL